MKNQRSDFIEVYHNKLDEDMQRIDSSILIKMVCGIPQHFLVIQRILVPTQKLT